jgi:hypothetical protein
VGQRNRREAPEKKFGVAKFLRGGADLDTGSIYPSPLYMYWESFIYLGREVWRLGLQSRGCFARAGLVAGSGRPFYHGRPGDNPRKIFHVNQDFKILHFDAVWKENTQKFTRSATTYCVLNAYTQGCGLGLDVSVSRRSRDVPTSRLGLVSVSDQ